jgi:hypothetical protein
LLALSRCLVRVEEFAGEAAQPVRCEFLSDALHNQLAELLGLDRVPKLSKRDRAPVAVAADMGHTLRIKRGDYGTPLSWVLNGGPGLQIGTVSVAAGGATTFSGSDHVPDATVGARWTITSSALQHGYFPGDDPGVPPWGGISSGGIVSVYAEPGFQVTVRRHGLRRSTCFAPPLHQRQRGDGLGGGPALARGQSNSRQLGGRARGIY